MPRLEPALAGTEVALERFVIEDRAMRTAHASVAVSREWGEASFAKLEPLGLAVKHAKARHGDVPWLPAPMAPPSALHSFESSTDMWGLMREPTLA